MLILLASLLVCNPPTRQEEILATFKAVCAVESGGDPLAVNHTENAVGIAQIRPCMVADCNRILGRQKYTLADRLDPAKSFEIFRLYSPYYAPNGTPETWARNWNGGPEGHRKVSTLRYWHRVQVELRKAH